MSATVVGAWDFGPLDTNGNGYGKAEFDLTPPAGTYYAQFTVRIGDKCDLSTGETNGCSVAYRTGTKMGQGIEKIIIPSGQGQGARSEPMTFANFGKIVGTIDPAIAIAKQGIDQSTFIPKCDWTGKWDTDFGQMTLQQSGNTVTGSYTYDGGQIQATASGYDLSGSWAETSSKTGTFHFTMADDCQSFSGKWGYGTTGELTGVWKGSRIQETSATLPTTSSGAMNTNEGNAGTAIAGSGGSASSGDSPSAMEVATHVGEDIANVALNPAKLIPNPF